MPEPLHNDGQLRRYWQRRARRECVRCGRPTGHGGACCLPCAQWKRDYQQRQRGAPETAAEKSERQRQIALKRWHGAAAD